jgi:hypothetical protein
MDWIGFFQFNPMQYNLMLDFWIWCSIIHPIQNPEKVDFPPTASKQNKIKRKRLLRAIQKSDLACLII